jgi:type II secretory ATPase GspE/PulE/Tfp pilus assembly ATPase PilB-like protein
MPVGMDGIIVSNEELPLGSSPGGEVYSSQDLALCSSHEARSLLPYESAIRLLALPIAIVATPRGDRLHCAVVDEGDDTARALGFIADLQPVLTCVSREILEDAIVRAYLGSDQRIRSDIERLSRSVQKAAQPITRELPKPQGDAAKFLTTLLEFSVARGASDLHLCPSAQGAFIRLRIDGELMTQDEQHYPRALHDQVVSRLKVLASMDIACKRLPQDGACTIQVGASAKCLRVSTLPTVDGESVVIRFLYARRLPQLSMLGLEPATASVVRRAVAKNHGVVLLSGPTGSGKTTTMYSIALELQNRGRNVVSVEDPVEAPIPGMVQVQVYEQQGLDFPRAIRSILRHDPDVILIGEMRDPVSARMALTAAVTGHLTISSLHMGSALQVLDRLRTFEISSRESSQAISLILNQRLLPRLCSRCKEPDRVGEEHFKRVVYKPVGCSSCNGTGFEGRVLITEALDLQSRVAKDIYSRAHSAHEALETLPAGVWIPWTLSLEHQLGKGLISVAQVNTFIDEEMVGE